MRRLLIVLALVLVPGWAAAQTCYLCYHPPQSAGGATWDGGAFTDPAEGPTGCTNPAYSFSGATASGTCHTGAGEVRVQFAASNPRGIISLSATNTNMIFVDAGSNTTEVDIADDEIVFAIGGGQFGRLTPSTAIWGRSSAHDQISIAPVALGAGSFVGSITSADLTAARTWTMPDVDWTARCLSAGTGVAIANACGIASNPSISVDTATTPQYARGTADPPATCTAGVDFYTETDTSELSYCIATNTWLLLLSGATTATLTNKTLDQNGTGNSVTVTKSTFRAGADVLSDDSYDGVVLTGWNCGETIAQWDAVYLDDTANEWLIADVDAAGKFPARGVVVAGCTDGNPGTVLVQGVIRNDGWNWAANGATLFLSDAGTGTPFTVTAPSTAGDCVQVVGFVLNDDQVYVNFSGHYLEVS